MFPYSSSAIKSDFAFHYRRVRRFGSETKSVIDSVEPQSISISREGGMLGALQNLALISNHLKADNNSIFLRLVHGKRKKRAFNYAVLAVVTLKWLDPRKPSPRLKQENELNFSVSSASAARQMPKAKIRSLHRLRFLLSLSISLRGLHNRDQNTRLIEFYTSFLPPQTINSPDNHEYRPCWRHSGVIGRTTAAWRASSATSKPKLTRNEPSAKSKMN